MSTDSMNDVAETKAAEARVLHVSVPTVRGTIESAKRVGGQVWDVCRDPVLEVAVLASKTAVVVSAALATLWTFGRLGRGKF